jgi:hypothetical protein
MIPYPEGEEFQATGLMVLERNWLDVYSKWEKWVGNKVTHPPHPPPPHIHLPDMSFRLEHSKSEILSSPREWR